MFSKGFKIVDKKRFEIYVENIDNKSDEAVVKIDTAAICKADLRYYLGLRDKRILGLKYPINLLHEATGTIIKDPTGIFKAGDKVALCPNIVSDEARKEFKICNIEELGDNYCPKAQFASSSINGFSRECISYPVSNLILLPNNVEDKISVFSEMISVTFAAIRRIQIPNDSRIAIWGDGILGYILYCVLSEIKVGEITVIGHNREKLNKFTEANCFTSEEFELCNPNIDIAFECVGGRGAESAINQIIDKANPGTKIVLTGVSEKNVSINTRKILEKGLLLCGVTRSHVKDFKDAVNLLNSPKFRKKIELLVLSENTINNIKDYYNVFELEANNRALGKHIMYFNF
ncbi:Ribitol-5-phosphate 2-dehydrogenase [Clostridium sp. DL-VIII]|uniref:alcohol dehydrogenase catalytic domain-containing protein n=1 Tax=Clostridium sp. DL-VIII TaxID=641107 RepID=UPI00023B0734|nr:alcohol dehydrogenase catalytic domain-containing protein [Clostridium sp. DL-VIII]EHJ02133.1 Ribitol-5-phosphate 2-dehydrogenase [Clostridium sp. DL-VIII]